MKTNTIKCLGFAVAFLLSFHLAINDAYSQTTYPCLTNYLDLSTGVNHGIPTSTIYGINQQDQYWAITTAPTNFNPNNPSNICATVWSPMTTPLGTGLSRRISYVNDWVVSDANIRNNCNGFTTPYTFRRKFRINQLTTGGINLWYRVDDFVDSIVLTNSAGVPIYTFTPNPCSSPTAAPVATASTPLTFTPGDYFLTVTVANLYIDGVFTQNNNPTPMYFELFGALTTTSNAIVDNMHFGKWTTADGPLFCGAPNLPLPFAVNGSLCLPAGATTTNLVISDFHSAVGEHTYTISGPGSPAFTGINTAANTANVTLGIGTYTITATDVYGCSFSSVIQVGSGLTVTNNPVTQCIPPGSTAGAITASASGGILPYSYSINSSIAQPTGTFTNLTQGNYTVVVTDAIGCTGLSTAKIGNLFTATLSSSLQPACAPTPITASTNPTGITGLTYSFNNGPYTPIPTTSANTAGVYNVTVRDAYGCTSSSSTNVFATPTFTTSFSPCVASNFTLTVNASGNPPFTYSLNGGTPQSSNQFNVQGPATYTVTVSSAVGCTSSQVVTTPVVTLSCCNPGITTDPNALIFTNTSSSTIGATLNNISGTIAIEGIFTINNNFSIIDCPNIRMGPDAQIVLAPGATLYTRNSTLSAACHQKWKGIVASNANNTITLDKATFIKDMYVGLEINGNYLANTAPLLQCQGAFFENDDYGIIFRNTPSGYQGYVISSFFYSTSTMLAPITRMQRGISAFNCKYLQIGTLTASATIPFGENSFSNVDNGIFISANKNTPPLHTSDINIYRCRFSSITGGRLINMINNTLSNNIYSNEKGCAIYSRNYSSNLANAIINLTVENAPGTMQGANTWISDCDKAIVTHHTNTTIKYVEVLNANCGFMNTECNGKKYNIRENIISNVVHGMAFSGLSGDISLWNNYITLPNTLPTAIYSLGQYHIPVGISVHHFDRNVPTNINMTYNNITIPCEGGIGIQGYNLPPWSASAENTIEYTYQLLNVNNVVGNPIAYGMDFNNSNSHIVYYNTVLGISGSQHSQFGTNASMRINNSQNLRYTCNVMERNRYGMLVIGNCTTSSTSFVRNHIGINVNSILFRHLGSNGTLGSNVGLPGFNPANTYGSTLTSFKLFRLSVCGAPAPDNFFTTPTYLTISQSGGNNVSCNYGVINNSNGFSIAGNCVPSNPPPHLKSLHLP